MSDIRGELKREYSNDKWDNHSGSYKNRVAHFAADGSSKLIEIAHGLHPFEEASSHVLDIGCGTGRLAAKLVKEYPGVKVLATDISSSMLRIVDEQHLPGVQTRLVDARFPFTKDEGAATQRVDEGAFSHVLSTFAIQFLPRPDEILGNMFRAAKPDGLVGLGIWDAKNVAIQSWGRACKHVDSSYTPPKAHDLSAWYTCQELEDAFLRAGCKKEDIRITQTLSRFSDVDAKGFIDFWFNEGNPAVVGLINDWNEKGNGKTQELKEELERIIREEHEDGKKIDIWMDLGVAMLR